MQSCHTLGRGDEELSEYLTSKWRPKVLATVFRPSLLLLGDDGLVFAEGSMKTMQGDSHQ